MYGAPSSELTETACAHVDTPSTRRAFCFFFQAEDGIRDGTETGVQTCALPIFLISTFSTRFFTSEQTGRVILPVLHGLFPWASRRMLYLMHFAIRKAAHVTEFGGFSITVFRDRKSVV